MHCFIVFPFFLKYLPNAEYTIVVDLLRRNPRWWSPVTSSAYGINLESRMLEKFVHSWQKRYAPIVITICFIPLLMDRYYVYDRLLPFFRHFLFIPNRNDKFMDRTTNCSTTRFNQFRWDFSIPGDLWFFSFSIANSTSKALGSGKVVLLCVFLPA